MPAERPESISNEDQQPSVSVILCTLGLRHSLSRCLDSIVSQNWLAETIVVLNGPPNENFAQTISKYPIRLMNETKRGVCAARNHAIRRAKGEILCFIDDDSIAHPNWIQEIVRGFEDPGVACVVGRVAPEGLSYDPSLDEHNYHGKHANSSWSIGPDPGWFDSVMKGAIMGFGCNFAFRRSFLLHGAMFPEDLGAGTIIGAADEVHMFIQVLKHGFRIFHAPDAVVTHVFDSDPVMRKQRAMELASAWPAYILRMLVEEKGFRLAAMKKAISSTLAFATGTRSIRSPQATPTEPDLLSRLEKLRAYLHAPALFLKSRRSR